MKQQNFDIRAFSSRFAESARLSRPKPQLLQDKLSRVANRLNLHFADSNRSALGDGSLDVVTIIRALYVIGHNQPGRYVSFEPLGPGGDPYPAMYGRPDKAKLDALVMNSIRYFRDCEDMVLAS